MFFFHYYDYLESILAQMRLAIVALALRILKHSLYLCCLVSLGFVSVNKILWQGEQIYNFIELTLLMLKQINKVH